LASSRRSAGLTRRDRRSLGARSRGRLLERCRKLLVGSIRREREVPGAGERIGRELGQAAVHELPLARGQALVEDRRE
jgi:hypothetical protein